MRTKTRCRGLRFIGIALLICILACGCATEEEMTPQSENKKGLSYYEAGDYKKAEEYFVRALSLDESDMEIHNNYGMTLIQLRRYDEALQQFDIVLVNSGNSRQVTKLNKFATRGKGLAFLQKQDYSEALTCFNNALEMDAENSWNVDILYYKANTLECMGSTNSAIDVYSDVLKEEKNNMKALLSRANLYRLNEKYEKAIDDYEQALKQEKGNYSSYIGLYTCYIAMGRADKGEDILKQASELEVKTEEDKYYLGQVHFYQKSYKYAKIEMEYAYDNGFPEASYFLGEIALSEKEYEKAIEYFEQYRAYKLSESPTVCNQEAVCYLALFQYEKAQEMLDIGLGVAGSPARQQLLRNQVALYEEQNELMKAYETLQEYIVSYPDDLEATNEYRFLKKRLGITK